MTCSVPVDAFWVTALCAPKLLLASSSDHPWICNCTLREGQKDRSQQGHVNFIAKAGRWAKGRDNTGRLVG